MGGFAHGPAQTVIEDQAISARNARYGRWLFALYLVLYGTFVLLNAFRPEVMDVMPIAGVNLAVLYGFFLIIAAFGLALVYAWLCREQGQGAEGGK